MTLTLQAALSMILMRLVSSEGWQKHLEEQGFVFPLGRLDPSLHARILDQVTVWESEGEMLGEAKSTWNAHLRSDAVMEAATNSQILDAVQEVLGEDVVLLHTTFFAKYPQNTTDQNAPKCLTVIGTHQDRTYWGINPESQPVVSVWVAIDNVTAENGAMRFAPGSHKKKFEHVVGYDECSALGQAQSIRIEDLPSEELVDMTLTGGEYGMFDSFAAHRSERNTSPKRRIGMTMIYSPPKVWFSEFPNIDNSWRKPLQVRCNGKACHQQMELWPDWRLLEHNRLKSQLSNSWQAVSWLLLWIETVKSATIP